MQKEKELKNMSSNMRKSSLERGVESPFNKNYNNNYDDNCICFDDDISIITKKESKYNNNQSLSEIRMDELNITMNKITGTYRTEGKIVVETILSKSKDAIYKNTKANKMKKISEGDKSYLDESVMTNDVRIFEEQGFNVKKKYSKRDYLDSSNSLSNNNDPTEIRIRKLINKTKFNTQSRNISKNVGISNISIRNSKLNKSQLSKQVDFLCAEMKDKVLEIKHYNNYTNFELSKMVFDVIIIYN